MPCLILSSHCGVFAGNSVREQFADLNRDLPVSICARALRDCFKVPDQVRSPQCIDRALTEGAERSRSACGWQVFIKALCHHAPKKQGAVAATAPVARRRRTPRHLAKRLSAPCKPQPKRRSFIPPSYAANGKQRKTTSAAQNCSGATRVPPPAPPALRLVKQRNPPPHGGQSL